MVLHARSGFLSPQSQFALVVAAASGELPPGVLRYFWGLSASGPQHMGFTKAKPWVKPST